MDPPNADILELTEMMRELFKVVQGLALGQKAIAERVEKIEKWMITERVQGNAPSSGVKKPFGNGQRKNEVRQQRQPPQQRAGYQVRGKGIDRQFDKPPVTYAVLFKKLMDLGLVQPRTMVPIRLDQRPPNYDENAQCEFHSGTPGHNIEGCDGGCNC
ncbi:hypothetical protein KIW84_075496 [Lathyrus oleraceus]|uniref:Uncharacterized protein n=1 Tax=Pisum sativum TaxID=3888 RepID=A0A9D4VV50_PEA|nr:hypothetical protein KIW84_075496 [Pisum sativum]